MKFALTTLALAAASSGCGTLGDTRKDAVEGFAAARSTGQLPVQRNVTAFAGALRCMDKLVHERGVKMSILVEDIADKTSKAPSGVSDMMLTALAQMSQRSSGALHTVTFGGDVRNLVDLMRQSGDKTAFHPAVVPAFAVRGSVSQFDENVARSTSDAGISLGPFGRWGFGAGTAESTSMSLVALDLSLINTRNFAVVPRGSTYNVAAIVQEGKGTDAEVSYHTRFGANYGRSFARSDGRSVAVRNLVELGAIELVGRFGRVPYWTCLGVPHDDPRVVEEANNWFEAMSHADELRYYLAHLRHTGVLPAEGEVEPAVFKLAFGAYTEALGLERDKFTRKLFHAHLAAGVELTGRLARALFEEEMHKLPSIELGFDSGTKPQTPGFTLTLSQPAYVHCFVRAGDGQPFRALAWANQGWALRAGAAHRLHELAKRLKTGSAAVPQALTCLATPDDRSHEVGLRWARLLSGSNRAGGAELVALRRQLAAQGGYVAMAALEVRGAGGR